MRRVRGVDVSHHQGTVDWSEVAGEGMRFAWVKVTEGSTFTDPQAAANWREASRAGLAIGGYHFFGMCGGGAEQGRHFADTLADLPAGNDVHTLPPALDIELSEECGPERAELLRELRALLTELERRTGEPTLVYVFPDAERRYRIAGALDRPQWVRRLGDRPPARRWTVWQRSMTAEVPGIDGPADLNVLNDPSWLR